ncbi:MAG: ABC transporter [Gammaproteobacteria bacterium]|nr:ABC transporter [Gammaproteobacteria bacterium]
MLQLFIGLRGWSIAASMLLLLAVTALLQSLPPWRMDLTEDKLYTLSSGSKALLAGLQEPVSLSLYFSRSLAAELPHINDYARRIGDLLAEYQALNPDRINLQVVDPSPFSEAEDAAVAAGLRGAPLALGGDALYLGLVASSASGGTEVISFFNPERERFLEYDISQLLYRLQRPEPPVVGLLSGVQMSGGYDFGSGQMRTPWTVLEQLQESLAVRELQPPLQRIEPDIGVLLIVQPAELDQRSLYAIDQYVLGGGGAMVFVDPHSEIATAPAAGSDSNIDTLLQHWGVEYQRDQIVTDRQRGLRVSTSAAAVPLPHVGILGLSASDMNRDDIITAELENINLASAGALAPRDNASTRFAPLLSSSSDAMLMASATYLGAADPGELLANFVSDNRSYVLAARVRGPASSAFTAAPAAADSSSETQPAPQIEPHRSTGNINVLLVADVDLLSDRLWVQVSDFFGQRVVVPWANNGDFVLNAVENLSGSGALSSLRSRGQYSRPFEVVDRLRSTAAAEFKQQEQVLLQRLEELEARIASLSADTDEQGQLLLSDAQRAEIEAFEQQRLATRKQLRQVQRQLNRSIDELENRLRWINMALLPALLLLAMFAVLGWRRHRAGL